MRQDALDIGAVHLILACLGILSHHDPTVMDEADQATLQHMATLTNRLESDKKLELYFQQFPPNTFCSSEEYCN